MFRKQIFRFATIHRHLSGCKMSTSVEDEILFQKVNSSGVIVLNRPKALNALNMNMVRKMYAQMNKWQSDPSIGHIVIKGAGGKAFCAGGDIRAIADAGKVGDPFSHLFFKEEYVLNHLIGTFKKPYIALIDGITMGGGLGLSVHGPFRVATEKTLIAMPETNIGLFSDVGGGYFLPRLEGQLGAFLALTGFRFRSRDVKHVGVATHFVDSNQMEELEKRLSSLSPQDEAGKIAAILEDLESQSTIDADKEFALKPVMGDINRLFSGATVEDICQALEKDGSEWATKQLDLLKKMSPTSMKITLRLIREGLHKTLAEDLRTEYRLAHRCTEDKDFYEGVRAVIVEKDNKPKWDPVDLKGVTQSKVDWYFSPLPDEKELIL